MQHHSPNTSKWVASKISQFQNTVRENVQKITGGVNNQFAKLQQEQQKAMQKRGLQYRNPITEVLGMAMNMQRVGYWIISMGGIKYIGDNENVDSIPNIHPYRILEIGTTYISNKGTQIVLKENSVYTENGIEHGKYIYRFFLQPPAPKDPTTVGIKNNNKNSLLTYKDYENFVKELGGGIDPLVLQAITLVESEQGAFLKNGNPVVRFEGHKFREYYKNNGIPEPSGYSDLFYDYSKTNTKTKPHGEKTFLKALALNKDAAIYATSFGFGQVMGFNYEKAGYNSLLDFYNAQFTLDGQIISFINFIKNNRVLIKDLKEKNFSKFAENYNGDSYKDNNYDVRMEAKYELLKKQTKK